MKESGGAVTPWGSEGGAGGPEEEGRVAAEAGQREGRQREEPETVATEGSSVPLVEEEAGGLNQGERQAAGGCVGALSQLVEQRRAEEDREREGEECGKDHPSRECFGVAGGWR